MPAFTTLLGIHTKKHQALAKMPSAAALTAAAASHHHYLRGPRGLPAACCPSCASSCLTTIVYLWPLAPVPAPRKRRVPYTAAASTTVTRANMPASAPQPVRVSTPVLPAEATAQWEGGCEGSGQPRWREKARPHTASSKTCSRPAAKAAACACKQPAPGVCARAWVVQGAMFQSQGALDSTQLSHHCCGRQAAFKLLECIWQQGDVQQRAAGRRHH